MTDQVDGATRSFATATLFVSGSLVVFLNGQRLRPLHDYHETSFNSFETEAVPLVGDHVLVQYETDVTETGFPVVVAYSFDPNT